MKKSLLILLLLGACATRPASYQEDLEGCKAWAVYNDSAENQLSYSIDPAATFVGDLLSVTAPQDAPGYLRNGTKNDEDRVKVCMKYKGYQGAKKK